MKFYLLIFIFLIGCSILERKGSSSALYQYHRDWAACDWVASEKMRDIKRDTFMEKLGYHLFHFRSDYRRQCLRSRGYDFYEEEEEYYDEDDD